MKRLAVFVLLSVMTMFMLQAQTESTVLAKIQMIKGTLHVQRGEAWQPLAVGTSLALGDTIKTGPKSYAELIYSEKIICKLGENTEITIKEFTPEKKTISHTLGKIWVKVQKLVGEKFEVETRFGTAGVRGTILGSQTDPATGTEIICEEGVIYLRTLSGEESEMTAGNACGFSVEGKLLPIAPFTGPGFNVFGLLGGGDGDSDDDTRSTPRKEKAPDPYRHIKEDIGRWENDFLIEGNNVDFTYIGNRVAMFGIWKKTNEDLLKEDIQVFSAKQDDEGKKLLTEARSLLRKIEELAKRAKTCDEIVKKEDALYRKVQGLSDKIVLLKNDFIYAHNLVDGSFGWWINQMISELSGTSYVITPEDRLIARSFKVLIDKYDSLSREYNEYQRLYRDAQRLNIIQSSVRLQTGSDELNVIITNFYQNTGNDVVFVVSFNDLKSYFMPMKRFLEGEGKVLLR